MNAVSSYYSALEDFLGQTEGLVDALLIGIAVISILLVVWGKSRTLSLAWLAYLVSP